MMIMRSLLRLDCDDDEKQSTWSTSIHSFCREY